MAVAELAMIKVAGAVKAAMFGLMKISIAAGPVALPLVITGAFGALLLMDQAASRTAHIIVKKGNV